MWLVANQSSGNKRLILDLCHVNQFLWKDKITLDDWKVAKSFFEKGDLLFSFDLKSGYHHIEIFSDHCKFLSFAWTTGNVIRYYSFLVLPFGLSTAPYVFTKCLRPLVKHWRSQGLFVVVYLDDGWGRASTEKEANAIASRVKSDLISAGLVPNIEKSKWLATQSSVWLGLVLDSRVCSIRVSDKNSGCYQMYI